MEIVKGIQNSTKFDITDIKIKTLLLRRPCHDVRFPIETPVELTPREMDVIQLLAEGLSNKEIAHLLFISPRTVNFPLDNIYSKLGVSSRTEAAVYALRHGWVRRTTM